MNDPNGIFIGENTYDELTGFDLLDPYVCRCATSGQPVNDIGSFDPITAMGSTATIDGVISSIPPVPEEVNLIAVAIKTKTFHFAAFPMPVTEEPLI